MYTIQSVFAIPDIDYMFDRIKSSIDKGIKVSKLEGLNVSLNRELNTVKEHIKNTYGIKNPSSPKQITEYLSSVADNEIIEACYDSDNRSWTSDKESLIKLSSAGYGIATDILLYRKIESYTKALKSIMNTMLPGNWVKPTVKLLKTNRISYSEPALMNIPKKLLWGIILPRNDKKVLFSIDIKQQEPWILINMLNIDKFKHMIENNIDGDFYEEVFLDIFGVKCNSKERNQFKTAWNALTYGASKYLINRIFKSEKADAVYSYFMDIPELKRYRNECYSKAKRKEQTAITYFGTEVYADEYGSRLKRVLMDIPIQGTGADILALLMQHFDEEREEKELVNAFDIYFTRHDELIIEVDIDVLEKYGEETIVETLRDIFEHRIDDWEPFKVAINKIENKEIKINELIEDWIYRDTEVA